MNQYAVMTNLDSGPAAACTLASLPLHVTILSIFFSQSPAPVISGLLEDAAACFKATRVTTIGRARFGVNRDIPVTLVEPTDTLIGWHTGLLRAVSGHATFRAPGFLGEHYTPHVTDQQARALAVGEDILLDNLTFVQITGEDVHVLRTLPLTGSG